MGYLQVYTGRGKGKTTAALGLAMRAYGAGLRIFFAQFLKKGDYSEISVLQKLNDRIQVRQYGTGDFFDERPSEADITAVRTGMKEVAGILESGDYDLIVLDEANVALFYKVIDIDDFIHMLEKRRDNVEVVVTGRYANGKLIEVADLVTEMKEVKHYYRNGIEARRGIEK
ncbi:cob(I)yrinic acid a,c-diamide adenosyltransferase [bacterium BMS3Abin07]|nr:cob(I)yrinic acid a,c-diamide adenosyltransferase [bacterium BMS3Abin07]GBE31580.1 cob(I)yrinic acid a,c-diamide adenosyltransferase [bacterium BMS3Bbin05]HDL20713.1 cob(I)yrinic acid a,c-diamide adenosyltransferase [Nitrospirota bacterium]HDO23568.1 cob(I)yrinic acid a,c-diamide adenosyltransferase [Nitrospirota bacterium]